MFLGTIAAFWVVAFQAPPEDTGATSGTRPGTTGGVTRTPYQGSSAAHLGRGAGGLFSKPAYMADPVDQGRPSTVGGVAWRVTNPQSRTFGKHPEHMPPLDRAATAELDMSKFGTAIGDRGVFGDKNKTAKVGCRDGCCLSCPT